MQSGIAIGYRNKLKRHEKQTSGKDVYFVFLENQDNLGFHGEVCKLLKHLHRTFPLGNRTPNPFNLIHIDVLRPLQTPSKCFSC